MGGRSVKLPFEELLEAHPSALETNVMAPGANPRETLEVVHALYDAARGAHDEEPNRKNEQHLQGGLAKIRNIRMVPKDQRA